MKIRYDRMQEELKPRQFMLSLSDADIKDFYRLAYRIGTTPAEILQGFICDLIDGTQTRGSDERMYAQQYIDRCCYDMMPQTFLSWILNDCRTEEIADLLQTADYAAGDLTYYAENPAEADPGFIDDLKQTEAEARQEIADIYREYAAEQEQRGEPAQEMQEGIEAVKSYLLKLETVGAVFN